MWSPCVLSHIHTIGKWHSINIHELAGPTGWLLVICGGLQAPPAQAEGRCVTGPTRWWIFIYSRWCCATDQPCISAITVTVITDAGLCCVSRGVTTCIEALITPLKGPLETWKTSETQNWNSTVGKSQKIGWIPGRGASWWMRNKTDNILWSCAQFASAKWSCDCWSHGWRGLRSVMQLNVVIDRWFSAGELTGKPHRDRGLSTTSVALVFRWSFCFTTGVALRKFWFARVSWYL